MERRCIFRRHGNRSFTIVLPGNAHRLTSCDNTLKSSIASLTGCAIAKWQFEARHFQRLDGCQSGVLAEKNKTKGEFKGNETVDYLFCYAQQPYSLGLFRSRRDVSDQTVNVFKMHHAVVVKNCKDQKSRLVETCGFHPFRLQAEQHFSCILCYSVVSSTWCFTRFYDTLHVE